jgi:hypothetical protein
MTGSQHTSRTPAATIGATPRPSVPRRAAPRHVHREQTLIRERRRQANRATVPTGGPLRWVLTLDGHRLAHSHLPAPHHADASGAATWQGTCQIRLSHDPLKIPACRKKDTTQTREETSERPSGHR